MVEQDEFVFVWQGITIHVSCLQGWPIETFCHVELRCDQRLPITETGYKSHFMPLEQLDEFESSEVFVRGWLDHASRTSEWRNYVEASRQGNLFA